MLSLMQLNENENILLFACKKYFPEQKNRILLVNPHLEDNQDIINPFYETSTFEVLCFCQLLLDKSDKTKNNYFLARGFDSEKGEGIIKLLKIMNKEKIYDSKIEYMLDIVFEDDINFLGFDRAISCIIQSKHKGNIILSSWEGNIYLLTPPNLDFFVLC